MMNCLEFSLDQWHRHGGYLVLRKSSHWLIPHVLHMSDKHKLTHYVPPADLPTPLHSLFGFRGHVLIDDGYPADPISKVGIFFGTLALLVLGGVWALKRVVRPIP